MSYSKDEAEVMRGEGVEGAALDSSIELSGPALDSTVELDGLGDDIGAIEPFSFPSVGPEIPGALGDDMGLMSPSDLRRRRHILKRYHRCFLVQKRELSRGKRGDKRRYRLASECMVALSQKWSASLYTPGIYEAMKRTYGVSGWSIDRALDETGGFSWDPRTWFRKKRVAAAPDGSSMTVTDEETGAKATVSMDTRVLEGTSGTAEDTNRLRGEMAAAIVNDPNAPSGSQAENAMVVLGFLSQKKTDRANAAIRDIAANIRLMRQMPEGGQVDVGPGVSYVRQNGVVVPKTDVSGDEHNVAGFGRGLDLCGWLFK